MSAFMSSNELATYLSLQKTTKSTIKKFTWV